jgi:hypothetical protein
MDRLGIGKKFADVNNVIDDFTTRHKLIVEKQLHSTIEQRIQLAVQTKPRCCPTWLWHKILKRVLVLGVYPHNYSEASNADT